MKRQGVGESLISEEELQNRIQELAVEIDRDYKDKHPIVISVLKGAFYFVADLTRAISTPVNIDFLAISQMPGVSRDTGIVRISKDLDLSIAERHVIMVEDIIDTGLTLAYLLQNLAPRRPKSLNVCVLLDNPARRLVELPIKYTGFHIPDQYVVGYGLDYKEEYRHLPYIAAYEKVDQ